MDPLSCDRFFDWRARESPRSGGDLVPAWQVGEAAVFWLEVYAVRASGAGEGEMLQHRHHEDENLHASQRLSNTASLP